MILLLWYIYTGSFLLLSRLHCQFRAFACCVCVRIFAQQVKIENERMDIYIYDTRMMYIYMCVYDMVSLRFIFTGSFWSRPGCSAHPALCLSLCVCVLIV